MRTMTNKKVGRGSAGRIINFLVLCGIAVFMVLPMIYTVGSSFKPLNELWVYPPRFLPQNPTWNNYQDLVTVMNNSLVPFSRYIFNTLLIAAVGTAGNVLLSSLSAYAFSKRRFPGQRALFEIVKLALMYSVVVMGIVRFLLISWFGWLNSYLAYIVPAFATSLGLYLMKQFMDQMIPDSVLEAARIDGAGEMHIFFRIVMPMVKSAWVTLIIFSFQDLWATGATNVVYSENLKTLNYALSQILAGGVARTGIGTAAAVLMMIVPLLVFIVAQSNVIETMATSGMKD